MGGGHHRAERLRQVGGGQVKDPGGVLSNQRGDSFFLDREINLLLKDFNSVS